MPLPARAPWEQATRGHRPSQGLAAARAHCLLRRTRQDLQLLGHCLAEKERDGRCQSGTRACGDPRASCAGHVSSDAPLRTIRISTKMKGLPRRDTANPGGACVSPNPAQVQAGRTPAKEPTWGTGVEWVQGLPRASQRQARNISLGAPGPLGLLASLDSSSVIIVDHKLSLRSAGGSHRALVQPLLLQVSPYEHTTQLPDPTSQPGTGSPAAHSSLGGIPEPWGCQPAYPSPGCLGACLGAHMCR